MKIPEPPVILDDKDDKNTKKDWHFFHQVGVTNECNERKMIKMSDRRTSFPRLFVGGRDGGKRGFIIVFAHGMTLHRKGK